MQCINGEWIMLGTSADNNSRLKSVGELIELVDEIGFLPLFSNTVPGFSVEEHTAAADWWSGNEHRDPWEWRRTALDTGKVAYGKFFDKKAGYISLRMLPYFVNWRRSGYDFDSRWDEGLASFREKKIMDALDKEPNPFSFRLKELAGFGPGGEKNFEGTLTALEMQSYVAISDFRCRTNKKGIEYGWHIARLSIPENLYGYDFIRSAYAEDPLFSKQRFYNAVAQHFPDTDNNKIKGILK